MVQLETFAQRKPHQLSGGQQQRVAIARAVVNKPRLLLLDESLSALDYKLRKQMQNELKALQRKLGITFVFVTHDRGRSTHHVRQDCGDARWSHRARRHAA